MVNRRPSLPTQTDTEALRLTQLRLDLEAQQRQIQNEKIALREEKLRIEEKEFLQKQAEAAQQSAQKELELKRKVDDLDIQLENDKIAQREERLRSHEKEFSQKQAEAAQQSAQKEIELRQKAEELSKRNTNIIQTNTDCTNETELEFPMITHSILAGSLSDSKDTSPRSTMPQQSDQGRGHMPNRPSNNSERSPSRGLSIFQENIDYVNEVSLYNTDPNPNRDPNSNHDSPTTMVIRHAALGRLQKIETVLGVKVTRGIFKAKWRANSDGCHIEYFLPTAEVDITIDILLLSTDYRVNLKQTPASPNIWYHDIRPQDKLYRLIVAHGTVPQGDLQYKDVSNAYSTPT
jgi:hypothetical protein